MQQFARTDRDEQKPVEIYSYIGNVGVGALLQNCFDESFRAP